MQSGKVSTNKNKRALEYVEDSKDSKVVSNLNNDGEVPGPSRIHPPLRDDEPGIKRLRMADPGYVDFLRASFRRAYETGKKSWAIAYPPEDTDELFVHPKKVAEFENWLAACVNDDPETTSKKGKICLLTGCSGTGKTAMAYTVAKKLGLTVKDFIPPSSLTFYDDRFDSMQTMRGILDVFFEFLTKSCQYTSLKLKGIAESKGTLVVVEDVLDWFYRHPSKFHQVLRSLNALENSYPVVFILSDFPTDDNNLYRLFPRNIMREMKIQHIKLNPVARTFMTDFLDWIVDAESLCCPNVDVRDIIEFSNGDMRYAINILQYQYSNSILEPVDKVWRAQYVRPSIKRLRKLQKNFKEDPSQRQECLFLFRALGKILYAKRDQKTRKVERLPFELMDCRRFRPLIENPDEIINNMGCSNESLLHFLQQNYPNYTSDIKQCAEIAGRLADGEKYLESWPFDSQVSNLNHKKGELIITYVVRALMFVEKKVTPSWKPFRKPIWYDLQTQTNRWKERALDLFGSDRLITHHDFMDTFPFYSKLLKSKKNSFTKDQKSMLRDLTRFNPRGIHHETLLEYENVDESFEEEKDEAEGNITDYFPPTVGPLGSPSRDGTSINDPDLFIEDFDD